MIVSKRKPNHLVANRFVFIVLYSSLCIIFVACGVKSKPMPPEKELAPKPEGVVALVREGEAVILIPPQADSKGPRKYSVSRREEGEKEYMDLETVTVKKAGTEPFVFRDDKIEPGKTYHYRVTPLNSKGEPGEPEDIPPMVFAAAPPAPASLTAEAGDGFADLNWEPPPGTEDDQLPKYNVYVRGKDAEYGYKPLNGEPLLAPEFLDVGLTNGVTFYYQVRALLPAGSTGLTEGPASEEVMVTPADLMPPAIPVALESFPDNAGIMLKWWPNHESDFKGYYVYLLTNKGPKKLNSEPVAAPEYLYEVKRKRTRYKFNVTAVDMAGNESDPGNTTVIRW